jgi:hypothetical protein
MPIGWWTVLVALVLVASVNLCLYFFYYAPALATSDEAAPTTTVELTRPAPLGWSADSP